MDWSYHNFSSTQDNKMENLKIITENNSINFIINIELINIKFLTDESNFL